MALLSPCLFCRESILDGEPTRLVNASGEMCRVHLECFFRSVCGSVGHQRHECSCYGQVDHTEDGLTFRQAARAALRYYRETHGQSDRESAAYRN